MGDNPFNDNPFAANTSVPAAGAWNGNSTAGAWGGAATNSSSYSAPSSGFVAPVAQAVDSGDTRKREADVARREAELNKREAEVRRMEMELANSPGAKNNKNWPKFCPVAHHDIAGEVPAAKQGMVRSAYWSYLGMVWCMFFNFVAVTGALIVNSGDNLSAWLWAVIYGLGGIPLGFTLWYMRVYNAAIKDRALSYGLFFIFYMAHLIFVGWSAVAPPILNKNSHAGIMSATSMIGKNTGVGVMYFISGGFWILEGFWSFWTLKRVYSGFRGQGLTAGDVKRDAAREAAQRGAAAAL